MGGKNKSKEPFSFGRFKKLPQNDPIPGKKFVFGGARSILLRKAESPGGVNSPAPEDRSPIAKNESD